MATNWIKLAIAENQRASKTPPVKTARTEVVSVLAATTMGDDCKKAWLKRWLNVHHVLMVERGFDEAAAAHEANQWLLVEWDNQHHEEQLDTSLCGHCGQSLIKDGESSGLPFLNGGGGHVWVHRDCHRSWMAAREAKAKSVLQSYGIVF